LTRCASCHERRTNRSTLAHTHKPAIDPYRACARCRCSQPSAGEDDPRLCTHTDVTWHGKPVSVVRARALGGACGPEADLAVGLW
jgi:methylphosphotriester-DNA--protein-cysteine methyltransferase